jgi:CheY-like chemotaxis protein
MATTQSFDLVLMDIQMPRVDGLEATRRIRGLEGGTGRHLPVVALSAHVMEEQKEECLSAGMDNFLSKPIDPQALEDLLDHFGRRLEIADLPDGIVDTAPAPEEEGGIAPDEHPFDLQELTTSLDGDQEILGELVSMFLEDSSRLLSRIRSGIHGEDASEVERAAHQLKGSAGNFRASRVTEEAYRLETLGRDGDLQAAGEALPGLERALADLQQALRLWVRRSP